MTRFLKNIVWALVIAFLLYYLVTRPEQAGETIRGVFGAFDAVGRFFATLAR